MSERLDELFDLPPFGAWFKALVRLMADGHPPVVRFASGETILRRGAPAEAFYVLTAGLAAVRGVFATETSVDAGPGTLLGELGVLFDGTYRRTVVAAAPTTAIVGTRSELEAALEHAQIGEHIASVAGRRLAENVHPVRATTSRGTDVVLRPLLPADRDLYLQALGRASLDTLRSRFFVARRPADVVVERMLHIDYVDHVAWIVLDPIGNALGICRWVVQPRDPGAAEIAVAVISEKQRGQGLGTLMIGVLGILAEARGLARLKATVLADNRAMRSVLDKAHARWTRAGRGTLEALMQARDMAALLTPATRAQMLNATRQLARVALLADA